MRIGSMMAAPALALLAACAVQPTAPTPAAAPPALAAAAGTPDGPSADAKYAEFVKYARAQGYKLVKTKDKELWCRDEAPLGSRLEKQSCITAAGYAEMQRQGAETRDQFRQGGSQACPPLGC